jgi:hypothetical protein
MDNPRQCARCLRVESQATEFHPESDVGPWDNACPGCGHICGDILPEEGACSRCGPLSEVERAELVRYTKDSSPHAVVSKLWRRFLDLEDAAARAERWEAWARHQEYCADCAEGHPLHCRGAGNGPKLWALCHPEDDRAVVYLKERASYGG